MKFFYTWQICSVWKIFGEGSFLCLWCTLQSLLSPCRQGRRLYTGPTCPSKGISFLKGWYFSLPQGWPYSRSLFLRMSTSLVPHISTILIRYPASFEIVCSSFLIIFACSLCGVLGTNRTDTTSSGMFLFFFLLPSSFWSSGGGCGVVGGGGFFYFLWLLCIHGVLFFRSFTTWRCNQISLIPNFFLSLFPLTSSLV